jgi:hypothetical protein
MVHVRNLDWPLAAMGPATRVFRFRRGAREFITVGVPGQVGVLSGMLPHAYSVTINWAPPVAFPSFDFGPAFLLRDTLETCDRYEDALQALTETHLATSVFFTLCGTMPGQACVIERTQRAAMVRPMPGPALTQANHHVAEPFARNNADIVVAESGEDFSLADSCKRADVLRSALTEMLVPCSMEAVANVLNSAFVLNRDTCQQMMFCPASGDVKVWRRIEH